MDIMKYVNLTVAMGVFLIIYVIKPLLSEKLTKFIPFGAATLGLILTILMAGTFNGELLVGGLLSGLAATGLKQLAKGIEDTLSMKEETPTSGIETTSANGTDTTPKAK